MSRLGIPQRITMAVHPILFVFVFAMAFAAPSGDLAGSFGSTKHLLVRFFEWFGNLSMFCGRLVRAGFTPPYEVRESVHQFDELGSKSLPLVALAGAATGVVLTRTQEFVLRWSQGMEHSFQEIVRQEWNFSPHGSVREIEDYAVERTGVIVLELIIVPNKSGGEARASLRGFRLV